MALQQKGEEIDYNKILNAICFCGVGLPWKNEEVLMAYPCEHLYHKSCITQCRNKCKICDTTITKYISMFDETIHHQRFADILSMSSYGNMTLSSSAMFIDSFFDLATIFTNLAFIKNMGDAKLLCESVFAINNLTLKVYGLDKIKLEKNKVYICNHVAHLEFAILYYLLGTGFLSSSIIKGSKLGDQFRKIVPLLIINRNGEGEKTKSTVEQMKDFVEEKGSICLFPEGMMTHPDALTRFRTGAFNIGYPVYAITIRHIDVLADGYINGFLYKLGGKKNINLDVHILGPYYPPFTNTDIEKIRIDMGLHGNMVLSRVSNKDIKDKAGDKF